MSEKQPIFAIPIALPQDDSSIPLDAKRIQARSTLESNPLQGHLQDALVKDIVSQGDRLLDSAKHLLTLQLAIPGLFAVLLKLIAGKEATLSTTTFLSQALIVVVLISWLIALFYSLSALRPEQVQVNPLLLQNHSNDKKIKGLLDYYHDSATRKHKAIVISSSFSAIALLLIIINMLLL